MRMSGGRVFVCMFTDCVRWDDEMLAKFQDTALKGESG